MSISIPLAAAHSAEAPVKIPTPSRNARLRLARSASRPAGTSSAAKTIAYAFSTHESVDSGVPSKLRSSAGNAMLTMKRSVVASTTPMQRMKSTRPGRVRCVMKPTLARRVASCNPLAYTGPMLNRAYEGQNCSIAATLELVGERWTLLILRDAFLGLRRFDEFQASLGVARNVLSARLNRLVEAGIFEKVRYSERPERFEYRLTAKGGELNVALSALRQWGDRHLLDEPPRIL